MKAIERGGYTKIHKQKEREEERGRDAFTVHLLNDLGCTSPN